ncbi:hypothetical protein CCP1ISM_50006 [Azospirillaceae bacterium]
MLGLLCGLAFSFQIFPEVALASYPYSFTNGTVADANEVNSDFDYFETKFSTTGGHNHDGSNSKLITTVGIISSALQVQGITTLNGIVNLNNNVNATGNLVVNGTFTTYTPVFLSETNISNLNPSQVVFTSATKDLVSVSNQTAINTLSGGVTANRLLRGNGSNILLAQADLTTDVTGVLPLVNGGTNSTGAFGGCRVTMSAAQGNLTSGAPTKVLFDTEQYDLLNEFASNKYTASVTGYYQVNVKLHWSQVVANKYYQVLIYIDTATYQQNFVHSSSTNDLDSVYSDIIYMAAGSYLEVYAVSNDGAGTTDLDGPPTTIGSTLSIHRLL